MRVQSQNPIQNANIIYGWSPQASVAAAQPAAAGALPLSANMAAQQHQQPQPASRAVPGIKYRHVGKSGLMVSNLALGNLAQYDSSKSM